MHEFELIKKYFSKLSKINKSALNLNDDVFFDRKKGLVISIDTYNEKTHFINFKNPELVIKKVIRSSISDLLCKGVNPKYYFISGSGNKKTFSKKNLSKISLALQQEQNKYGILLCGGDTTFSNRLSFSITSIGFSKKIIYRNNVFAARLQSQISNYDQPAPWQPRVSGHERQVRLSRRVRRLHCAQRAPRQAHRFHNVHQRRHPVDDVQPRVPVDAVVRVGRRAHLLRARRPEPVD